MKPKSSWPVWLIKLCLPEYWGVKAIYFRPFLYVIWNTLKLKNKFYPLILNPAIDDSGGFIGANKTHINSLFPQQYLPRSLEWNSNIPIAEFAQAVEKEIGFPCFIKPNNTHRGIGVAKLENTSELYDYLHTMKDSCYVQAALSGDEEYGVFVAREPGERLRILSLTGKQFLQVTGNGKSTIQELLAENIRYIMAKRFIDPKWQKRFQEVPAAGEKILIQPVGNHNKGTHFMDVTDKITEKMVDLFDQIVPAQGIYYGRFDVKAENIESLETGKGLGIIEFNGTVAEPISYCDPHYSYFQGQKIIMEHYRWQLRIALKLMEMGAVAPSLQEGIRTLKKASQFKKEKVFTFND